MSFFRIVAATQAVAQLQDALDKLEISYWSYEEGANPVGDLRSVLGKKMAASRYVVSFITLEYCQQEWTRAEFRFALKLSNKNS